MGENANVRIKSERVSPTRSADDLILPSAIKKEPTTRLPSFKAPRDLTLIGTTSAPNIPNLKNFINNANKTTKKQYVPNFVTRKGGNSSTSNQETIIESNTGNNSKERQKKTNPRGRGNSNVVQTKGVFSEGLAPTKSKGRESGGGDKQSEPHNLQRPKLNPNVKVSKKDEDNKLKSLLKDDFIDDPSVIPDISFIPSCLPKVYNMKGKQRNYSDINKTFDSLQMKMEKVGTHVQGADSFDDSIISVFKENELPRMLVFEFPRLLPDKEEAVEKKKPTSKSHKTDQKSAETEEDNIKTNPSSVSSLGEGLWGHLRIHENGKAFFIVGKNKIPVVQTRHFTRQDVVSTHVDPVRMRGEVINLGTVDATFTCSTDFYPEGS